LWALHIQIGDQKVKIVDVRAWLSEHGFKDMGPHAYFAPYAETLRVIVQFSSNEDYMSVLLDNGFEETKLHSGKLSRFTIDNEGMLSGAGLKTPFLVRFFEHGVTPVWFTEELVYGLREPARDVASRTPRV
jgi:hypothetical protein